MLVNRILNIYNFLKIKRLKGRLKDYGEQIELSPSSTIFFPENVEIGSFVYLGPRARIDARGGLIIKSGTIIGPEIKIHTANHVYREADFLPYDSRLELKSVMIGENVWIGGNVILVPGACIGEGCIIGAGSVVSGVIPPYSVVVGNPAKVVKTRDVEHYLGLKREGKIYLKHKLSRK